MLKRLLIIGLALLICAPVAEARKKKEKSGELNKGVFSDTEYGYKFNVLDNWKAELMKKDSEFRVVLTQKNHKIPPELMPYPKLARVPTIDVYICEMPFGALEFIDSLASSSYSSKEKKAIMRDIRALEENVIFDGLKTSRRATVKIGDMEAAQWEGTANFTVKQGTFETSKRSFTAGFVVVKNGDYMLSFTITSEGVFFPEIMKEAMTMMESLQWGQVPEEE